MKLFKLTVCLVIYDYYIMNMHQFLNKFTITAEVYVPRSVYCTDLNLTWLDPVSFEGIFKEVSLKGEEGRVHDAANRRVREGCNRRGNGLENG